MSESPTLRTNLEASLSTLKAALVKGDAMLILGQDHTPSLIDQALLESAALLRSDVTFNSLPELISGTDGEDTGHILSSLFRSPPTVSLLELASLPWTSVITSAVDDVVLEAFRSSGDQRRIIELGPGQLSSISTTGSSQLLYFVRAFGSAIGDGSCMAPASPASLAEARLIRFPGIVSMLPRLIGLHGFVVVEGVTERDWLDEQALAVLSLILASIPYGRVFWFGPVNDKIHSALKNNTCFIEDSLQSHLRLWAKDQQLQAELRPIRDRIFGLGDRVLSLDRDGHKNKVVLTGQEWRSISRIASLLDDDSISSLQRQEYSLNDNLATYLRRSHAGVPDWTGPARGFIFERDSVARLIRETVQFVGQRKSSILQEHPDTKAADRVPYLLSGPPASGKSMGLLYAAWTLRVKHGICALWLLPGISGLDVVAVERVCRLLETKGSPWIVLFLDTTDLDEYTTLKRRLESDGRRILVIGAESRLSPVAETEKHAGIKRFTIDHRMSSAEVRNVKQYFLKHQVSYPTVAAGHSKDFLRVLAAAIPEIRIGALPSLLDEYEQVMQRTKTIEVKDDFAGARSTLAEQLSKFFPDAVVKQHPVTGRFTCDPLTTDLLFLIFFCAQLDRPAPVDLLMKVLGNNLISKYTLFSEIFAETALVHEVDLDNSGSVGLTTGHQIYAMWLLRALMPEKKRQLEVLQKLASAIDWNASSYPGENPNQDFVLDIFRLVGPRGEYKDLYSSRDALDKIRSIIGEIRERLGLEQPRLLTLEAIILGDLAVRANDVPSLSQDRCILALALLERAEDILSQRKPSAVRNFELQRVLTLSSDIRGTMINTMLRGDDVAVNANAIDRIMGDLSRIEEDAIRAQSYSASYPPLDVSFWAHRDAFDLLPQSMSPALRLKLVEGMESILELAREENLDPSQVGIYNQRRTELECRRGNWELSKDLARKMREKGNYAGELSLSRARIRDSRQEPAAILTELNRLYEFRPQILQHEHGVRYMQNLWCLYFVPGRLGDGPAKMVRASDADWQMLAEITRARLQFPGGDQPYAMFFHGWSLYQTGDPRAARRAFTHLDTQSQGNPRRVGELAYITDADGSARVFRARIANPRPGQVQVTVPELDGQSMQIRPEIETRIAPGGFRLGELVTVSVALNYRGVQCRPDWEPSRLK